jgi:hypothetical protein
MSASPEDPSLRSVRTANPTIARLLCIEHARGVLSAVGFAQAADGSDALACPAGTQLELAVLLALGRLDRCLKGLEGIAQPGAQPAEGGGHASAAGAQADGASHRCSSCRNGIRNDMRAARRQGGDVPGWRGHDWNDAGEYRYHCAACNQSLCSKCYDMWKARDASTHALEHALEIVPPITTPWGGTGYGSAPAPPSLNARPRRGAWG